MTQNKNYPKKKLSQHSCYNQFIAIMKKCSVNTSKLYNYFIIYHTCIFTKEKSNSRQKKNTKSILKSSFYSTTVDVLVLPNNTVPFHILPMNIHFWNNIIDSHRYSKQLDSRSLQQLCSKIELRKLMIGQKTI